MNLEELRQASESLPATRKMPVLFIGHGSPVNGIEDNLYTRGWREAVKDIPVPRAVVCISAHWLTRGTYVTAMDFPHTIHDFSGFQPELYQVRYPAPGSPSVARELAGVHKPAIIGLDHEWGLDHGTWTVVCFLYFQFKQLIHLLRPVESKPWLIQPVEGHHSEIMDHVAASDEQYALFP